MPTGSRIPAFYQLAPQARREALLRLGALDEAGMLGLDAASLSESSADLMVENVVGTFALPFAVGVNLQVNGDDVLVPMVVEEPSVVAAVSNMARLTRAAGGLRASADPDVMIGQVQITDLPTGEPAGAAAARRGRPRAERHRVLAGARACARARLRI